MSEDKSSTNMDNNNIVPYETLKASLDAATAEMEARYTALLDTIHRADPPLYIAIAMHHFNAAYAVVTARSNAVISEYGHLAGVTQRIQDQRDEANRKLASLKKTVNQIKKLNLDDEGDPKDTGSTGSTKNDGKDQNNQNKPNDQNNQNKPNDPNNKGKRRKK